MEIRSILNGAIAVAALAATACSHKSETDAPPPQQSATAAADTAVGQARQSRDSLAAAQNAVADSVAAAGDSVRP